MSWCDTLRDTPRHTVTHLEREEGHDEEHEHGRVDGSADHEHAHDEHVRRAAVGLPPVESRLPARRAAEQRAEQPPGVGVGGRERGQWSP